MNINNCFVFFLFVFSFFISNAQDVQKDSLSGQSYKNLYDLFNNNFYDTIKAKVYADYYLKKAKREDNLIKIESGKYFQSLLHNDFHNYYTLCDSLINIAQRSNDVATEMKIRCSRGETYFNNNSSSKTLKEFLTINKLLKKTKHDSIASLSNIFIGLVKWKNNGQKETIQLFKKVDNYLKDKNPAHFNDAFLANPMHLAILYTEMNKRDSADYYLTKAENIYNSIDDSYFKKTLHLLKYQIAIDKEEYDNAIKELHIYIPYLKKIKNFKLLTRSYSRLATCYEKIAKPEEAFIYHSKADSIFNLKKIPSSYLEDSFQFLSNHYKQQNDYQKQLEYVNKLLTINQIKTQDEKETIKVLSENYDQPKLLAEKNALIHKLESKTNRDRLYKILYAVIITITLLILFFQTKRKSTYKKKFLKLINQKTKTTSEAKENTTSSVPDSHALSQEVSKELLQKLKKFERNKEFLNPKINLKFLADSFSTNSSYLSKVINQHKEQTFSNYINQLRINYIVEELPKNTTLQKYTVKALAKEVGFKSADSFSKAFYKFTNMKPSSFINELKKVKDPQI